MTDEPNTDIQATNGQFDSITVTGEIASDTIRVEEIESERSITTELRVNQLTNRSGLGTVTHTDTGSIVSGIVTATTFSGDVTGNLTGNVNATTGISTFSNIKITGKLTDGGGATGSAGQVLSSDGTDLEWINTSAANVASASKIGVNDSSNSTDTMYLTFVDATSGNEEIRIDIDLKYKPSTGSFLGITTFNSIVVDDDVTFTGNSSDLKWDHSADALEYKDNTEARFGNNNDLKISHTNDLSGQNDSEGNSVLDGSNWCSYIQEVGTGPLIFKSNGGPSTGAFQFYDTAWRPILKLFSGTNARAALYNTGLERLITDTTGVEVTGGVKCNSTTNAFYPPRVTTSQRDLMTVTEGAMVYNTQTNKLNFYNGSGWEAVTSA